MNQLASDRCCALILATLVGAACGEGEPSSETAQPDRTAEVMAALEANPCDAGSNAALADSTLAALLTGVGHVENEVYDGQRLVISLGAAGEFGPLVALFPMDATLGLARSAFVSPVPAVTMYSWGAAASADRGDYVGGYPDLEIDPGPIASGSGTQPTQTQGGMARSWPVHPAAATLLRPLTRRSRIR